MSVARSRIRKKVGVAGQRGQRGEWERHIPSLGTSNSCQSQMPPRPTIYSKSGPFHMKVCFIFVLLFSWQVKNMNKKDKRLKIMNEILNGIKVRSREYSWPFSVCNEGSSGVLVLTNLVEAVDSCF